MSSNRNAVFLDVDSTIVEKNLRFANEDEEDFNQMLSTVPPRSKVIKPFPGLCIKTRELISETKVFVNICQTDAIPPPKNITEEELIEIIESDEPSNYRVPMSIGEERMEKDKSGEDAKVIDIAINPIFFKKISQTQSFKNFFFAVAFQGLENKYGIHFVNDKIILKNRKAFGTLQSHRIQDREIEEKMKREKGSIIEEITGSSDVNKKKVVIETISSEETKFKEPEYRLFKRKKGPNCLIGEFKLPDIISSEELTLDVGEDRILLESKSKGYLLDIFVPYIVRQESCSSSFEKTTKILTVTMPLVGG